MKSEERIKQVKISENTFIEELVLGLFVPLVSDDISKKLLKDLAGVEVGEKFIPQQLSEQIDSALPKLLEIQENGDYLSQLDEKQLQLLKLKFRDKHSIYSMDEISNSINNTKTINDALNSFLTVYNYIRMVASSYMDASQETNPILLFDNFENLNKYLVKTAKKTEVNASGSKIYDVSKSYFEKYLNPEFKELLSKEQLKKELTDEKKLKENTNLKNEISYFEVANQENEYIDNEINMLRQIKIASEETEKIAAEKEKYNSNFGTKFVKIDDESIISIAREYLSKIQIMINDLKSKIADALVYAGDDIKDVLREKHSYQIRDYIEKLSVMSNKYEKSLQNLDKESLDDLLVLYNKAMAMYQVIDEMKANSYVIDISRFSK